MRLICAALLCVGLGVPLRAVVASSAVSGIPVAPDPGALILDGNLLYASHTGNLVTVIDVSTYGAEQVVQTIVTPVSPVDLCILGSSLCVVDQDRDAVWHKPLSGGGWTSVALPATTTQWTYGDIIYPHPMLPDRVFVIQFYDDRVFLVNIVTGVIEATLSNLDDLPTSIVFSGDGSKMAVLCQGFALGGQFPPNVAVFDVATLTKVYQLDLPGQQLRAMAAFGDALFIIRDSEIRKHVMSTGQFQASLPAVGLGRHAVHNGGNFLAQSGKGFLYAYRDDLVSGITSYSLLQNDQVWFPPLEEMVAMPSADGRVFVTNRNDGTVSVVRHFEDCFGYGNGCTGSAGVIPTLSASGCPLVGTTYTAVVGRGLGGAPAFLFLGVGMTSIPLGSGCKFLVSPVLPPFAVVPLSGFGAAAGEFTFDFAVPPSLLLGSVVTMQALIADPGTVAGFSATAGLHLTIH